MLIELPLPQNINLVKKIQVRRILKKGFQVRVVQDKKYIRVDRKYTNLLLSYFSDFEVTEIEPNRVKIK